ncbi:manganese efflux pump [Thermanaerosceptrum fracticalcis]|jgi:putative Mn2+ efflux pump MntP|uniref:Putative manganese efflux pump MntP n=1 Tax=Thermanaerosceptrum fracticalcis TaxID=1712410 RepID=A0A7G6E4Q4_THEFR|nr:manganese efflux pump [Thermanaerosceptrum fracticalcis]QNB47058.1 manganese efflux pump [Thermanaerosceptrum fracticalcis]
MNYSAVLLVSIALGIDAFSVAIGIGLAGIRRREIYLVSGVVCLFHIFMPLLGLTLGTYLGKVAGPVASVIGALVLITIGLSTIWENIRELGWGGRVVSPGTGKVSDVINIGNPVSLAVMAASVSLDALTAGFSLGTLRVDLTLTVITMGLVAGVMTAGGLIFGKRLNRTIGERAEILGGAILVLIGLKFLF